MFNLGCIDNTSNFHHFLFTTHICWYLLSWKILNTSPSLQFLFQAFPFYGDVLLLLCSVFMEHSMGTAESIRWFIRTRFSVKATQRRFFLGRVLNFTSWNCFCLQARDKYEKILEDVSTYTPRYMEEMEAIFEQSQEEERKRISFLKQVFLSIHRHLDVTNNERWATTWMLMCTNYLLAQEVSLTVSSSLCQCQGSLQWAPPNFNGHRWARWSQMVEEQSRSRHAHRLAKDWGTQTCKQLYYSMCDLNTVY